VVIEVDVVDVADVNVVAGVGVAADDDVAVVIEVVALGVALWSCCYYYSC
jgi:tryptophan synthase alpha subunit